MSSEDNHSAIELDVSNMFRENLQGDYGFNTDDIEEKKEAVSDAHSRIEKEQPGFMKLPFEQDQVVDDIIDLRDEMIKEVDNFVVLGIGGSALGNIAVQTALNPPYFNENCEFRGASPRLYVPDNVDPVRFASLLDNLNLSRTIFNVISKSGTTAETMSLYLVARDRVAQEVGEEKIQDHFIATTSSSSGYLLKIAEREGFPEFYIPEDVGGRFSVLSPVGLVSSAFCGVDIEGLLAGAADMARRCQEEDVWNNPAYMHGLLHYLAYQQGKNISVMMPYSHLLKDVADWYRQLWAESLGKAETKEGQQINAGQTPVKALGATDQHSQLQLYMEGPRDKVVNFIEVEEHDRDVEIPGFYDDLDGVNYLGGSSLGELLNIEKRATEMALSQRGRLNCTIKMPEVNAHTLGQLFYMLELETALVGELLDINAFNQPGVELGKNYTYGVMGREGYEDMKEEFEQQSRSESKYSI